MPSTNPRYANHALRESTRRAILQRVAAGEPCALCGKPIDLTLPQTYIDPKDGRRKRAPWSCEVDEIVPISRGGLPYGDNCQPAHRRCNQLAGNKRKGQSMRPLDIPDAGRIQDSTTREW